MLKIIKFSDKPCFLTGAEKDVFEVKFTDRSFNGVLSWSALLEILKKRKTVAETTAGDKVKREAGQASSASPIKPED